MFGTTQHELPVELNQLGESRCYGVIKGAFLRLLATKAFEFPEYCTFVNVNQNCVAMEHSSHNCGYIRKIAFTQSSQAML